MTMTIEMQIPAQFLFGESVGKIVRYGTILKDVDTGRILGHLKEAGEMGKFFSDIAVNPIKGVADIALNIDQSIQLRQLQGSVQDIKQTLEQLGLVTNVAALASIAGLGVSIAGFAIVSAKLNKIESKLDEMAVDITAIKKGLDNLNIKWDAMSEARLQTAGECMLVAERATTEGRVLELAKEAASEFAKLRHYYSNLLRTRGLFSDISLPIEQLYELIARYTYTCLGVLQAEFLTGDLGAYRKRLELIQKDYSDLVLFNPRELYQNRCDQLGPLPVGHDFEALSTSVVGLDAYVRETAARIETATIELDYLDKNNISAQEYIETLRNHESGLVLIPSDNSLQSDPGQH
jgi:hypothetical protein